MKLTDLNSLNNIAGNDELYIVDVSDTTESAQGTSKKITRDQLAIGINHSSLASLLLDDHTQYALLSGRGTGQTLSGGSNASGTLTLDSTSNATKGNIFLNPSGGNVGIGTTSPSGRLTVANNGNNGIIIRRNTAVDRMRIFVGDGTSGYTTDVNYIASANTDLVFLNGTTADATAERMRITNGGNVGVANNSPLGRLHINAPQNAIVLEKASNSNSAIGPIMYIQENGQTTSGRTNSEFAFFVAGTGSVSSSDGPYLTMKGSNFARVSNLRGYVELAGGTVSGATGLDGRLQFSTAGTSSMEIAYTGEVLINKNTVTENGGDLQVTRGISFPNAQSACADVNTLDDYEEGTFTPRYVSSIGSLASGVYDIQVGRYTKIGNVVFVQGAVRTDGIITSAASGTVRIEGLPFTTANISVLRGLNIHQSEVFAGDVPSSCTTRENTTYIDLFYRTAANGNSISLVPADLGTGANSNLVIFSGHYQV